MKPGSNDEITDDLLIRFLYREADVEEQRLVEQWLLLHEGNKRHLEQLQFLQEQSRNHKTAPLINLDEEWQFFQQRLATEENFRKPRRRLYLRVTGIAAAVLIILAGLSAVLFYGNKDTGLVVVEAGPRVKRMTLPDGSVLTLNKGAVVSYDVNYKQRRAVTLAGESFFEVVPDKKHPFVITTEGIQVRVLGTSFNVRTASGQTEVVVAMGRVALKNKDREIELAPLEKGLAIPASGLLTKVPHEDQLYNYYRTRTFICKGTSLEELAAALSVAYDLDIVIPDAATRRIKITATYHMGPVDEILDIICHTLELKSKREGRQVILK